MPWVFAKKIFMTPISESLSVGYILSPSTCTGLMTKCDNSITTIKQMMKVLAKSNNSYFHPLFLGFFFLLFFIEELSSCCSSSIIIASTFGFVFSIVSVSDFFSSIKVCSFSTMYIIITLLI